ncbi:MAG: Coenzyme F420 hydrogenase/dehydrogenase, beta subunit C-terminal domain [Candidatus Bathyarchaeia archaeon]
MSSRPKVFGHLLRDVIRKDLCVGCGTCVSVCPTMAIDFKDDSPALVGQCIACGMCYANCPRTEHELEDMEEEIFGKVREDEEELTGVMINAYAVRAKDDDLRSDAQDGGAVTAILCSFLSSGGDAAIVAGTGSEKPWLPEPVVARDPEEVKKYAGTKYTSSPTMVGVLSAIKEFEADKIAVVGTPCQMLGLTRTRTGGFISGKIDDAVELKIGLFCMETYDYDKLMDYLEEQDIDPSKVTKFEIKSGKFYAYVEDKVIHEVKISQLKDLVRNCCHYCGDFASELSDISVGNVGSPDKWSTVITRTERGEEALKKAEDSGFIEVKPLSEVKPGLSLVRKLSGMKKKQRKEVEED